MILALLLACQDGPHDRDTWAVSVVEYAHSDTVEASRFVSGAPGTLSLSWSIGVLRGHGRVVLVDTGTDLLASAPAGAAAQTWGVTEGRTLPDALARVGLAPKDVTDVILTHEHWDHADGIQHLAHARVVVPEGTWRRMRKRVTESGPAALLAAMDAIDAAGRRVLPEQAELPDVTVRLEGRHTPTHTTVQVGCAGGSYLFAGDAIATYAQVDAGVPITMTADPEGNRADIAAMRGRLSDAQHLLVLHDPALYTLFPSAGVGVATVCP